MAAFTHFTPDVFAPHLIEFQRDILRQYAAIPLAGVYRLRRPGSPPLYQLLEGHYPAAAGFRAAYEERFESQYGFWRPVIDRRWLSS